MKLGLRMSILQCQRQNVNIFSCAKNVNNKFKLIFSRLNLLLCIKKPKVVNETLKELSALESELLIEQVMERKVKEMFKVRRG
jgi:hypothetical protein